MDEQPMSPLFQRLIRGYAYFEKITEEYIRNSVLKNI